MVRTNSAKVDDLGFFCLVAESATLTAVARELGTSLSVVSRRLAGLEERLGVQLVRRTTRRLEVTIEGRVFAERAGRILAEIEDAEESVRRDGGPLQGLIRVQASPGLGRRRIAALVARFQGANPGIAVQLTLSSAPLGPSASPFDIGIRVGPGKDSRLVARRIARNARAVCASPDYLQGAAAAPVLDPDDLQQHDCIVLRQFEDDFAIWKFRRDDVTRSVRVRGPLSSNDGEVVTNWCLDGHGVMLRSRWHVQPLIDSGALVELIPEWETEPADIFVTYQPEAHTPQRVTSFIGFLEAGLSDTVPGRPAG